MSILLAAVIVAILIIAIFILVVKKNQKREKQYCTELKNREDILNRALLNPKHQGKMGKECHPYKVSYNEMEEKKSEFGRSVFQIIEKTERSERKFLFYREETVYIGEQHGIITITKSPEETKTYCKINFKEGEYCICSMSNESVSVKRKHYSVKIDQKGICLKSKDRIQLRGRNYTFQIIQ